MESGRTLPQDLAVAFHAAIETYAVWIIDRGTAQKIQIGRDLYDMEAVCNLVSSFTDLMPTDDYDRLCQLAGRVGEGSMAPADRTYQCGARCLKMLVEYWRSLKAPRVG